MLLYEKTPFLSFLSLPSPGQVLCHLIYIVVSNLYKSPIHDNFLFPLCILCLSKIVKPASFPLSFPFIWSCINWWFFYLKFFLLSFFHRIIFPFLMHYTNRKFDNFLNRQWQVMQGSVSGQWRIWKAFHVI